VSKIKKFYRPFESQTFLSSKKGKLRQRYKNALDKIINRGFDCARDSDISAFVKNERYYEQGKSPRMIMGRNPIFNWYYAQIVEPIEKAFFQLPQVANACDYAACGEKFSKLVGEWFVENDMSKFEASQRAEVLDFEYLVYKGVLPTHMHEFLKKIFALKLHKKGHTNCGIKFVFDYCRGSGDMDTSLGNGILNYIATQYFLIKNFCPHCTFDNCREPNCKTFKFVLKGDDSYMSVPRFSEPKNYYQSFGFDAKLIVRKHWTDVEFCSGHFVQVMPGKFYYVQKLKKLISSLTTCINDDIIRNGWVAHYYKSLGMMYKVLYKGIPIYEDIADFLIESNVRAGLNINLVSSYNLLESFKSEHVDVEVDHDLAYSSVMMVNDLSVPELEAIKTYFRSHKLQLPEQMTKVCRIKTEKSTELPTVDWPTLNARFNIKEANRAVQMHMYRLSHWD